jgi:DNA-binding transcriptional MerR regulator
MPSFSIGQLARRAGVAIDTVRYYERSRLPCRRRDWHRVIAATARPS